MAQLLFDECNSHQRQTPTKRQKKFVGCFVVENPLLPATA